MHKPLPRSCQDSCGFPECPHDCTAHFREHSSRGHYQGPQGRGKLLDCISLLIQSAKWKDRQREPDRCFAGEEREETHFGVHSVPKYWSLGPLGNGCVGPHLPLLGPLVPLGAVIIPPMRHLPRHQASDRSSGRYCHPHFTD